MTNYNKLYKYETQNRCDDCNKFFDKRLAILGDAGISRCHLCNQRLRVKPRSPTSREYYKDSSSNEPIEKREFVEFIYCKCGCGKTRSKYRWYNKILGRLRPDKPAQYINGHSFKKKKKAAVIFIE